MIAEARRSSGEPSRHLSSCPECSELVELLRAYNVAGELPLAEAPAGWVAKAVALGRRRRLLERVKQVAAELIFDSWTAPQPVGVRGAGISDFRRLRFSFPGMQFDLRAERQTDRWAIVAQISGAGVPKIPPELRVDNQTYFADKAGGLYQWWSPKPPRRIQLHFQDKIVILPNLMWKKRRST